jgi:hypothetical protein
MTSIPRLTSEQQSLLCLIVEASRAVPREEFYFSEGSNDIQHSGLPENHEIFPSDLRALTNARLLDLQRRQQGMSAFEPTALAFDVYGLLKQRQGEPVQRVEAEIRSFFDHGNFREAHPEAFKKWLQAEELLWRSDTAPQLTTIGHLAREAMQEFATSLMKRYGVPEGDTDKAKTINRVKRVLDSFQGELGTTEQDFLGALIEYWRALDKLVQRQEHGALREQESLTWPDARRVVFQLMVVMFEIESSLSSARSAV